MLQLCQKVKIFANFATEIINVVMQSKMMCVLMKRSQLLPITCHQILHVWKFRTYIFGLNSKKDLIWNLLSPCLSPDIQLSHNCDYQRLAEKLIGNI